MTISSVPRGRLNDHAALRLLCLPCAGGGTAAFHRWRPELPTEVDLVPLVLPGHDGRLTETPRTDLSSLVHELADDVRPAIDRLYVLVGHSLGAWIAFELARELRRRGARLPELLVLAAARPPDTSVNEPPMRHLADDDFLATVQRRFDGIPHSILGNAELLQLLLPVLRADFEMVESHRYTAEPPLDVDILALGGTDDPAVTPGQLTEWRRHTTRNCSVRLFPGGHFFLFRGEGGQAQSAASDAPSASLRTIVTWLEPIFNPA